MTRPALRGYNDGWLSGPWQAFTRSSKWEWTKQTDQYIRPISLAGSQCLYVSVIQKAEFFFLCLRTTGYIFSQLRELF